MHQVEKSTTLFIYRSNFSILNGKFLTIPILPDSLVKLNEESLKLIGDDLAAMIAAKPREFLTVEAFASKQVGAVAMLSEPTDKKVSK